MDMITHDEASHSPAGRARAWLAGHEVPVNQLPPSKLMAELAGARRHPRQLLAADRPVVTAAALGPFCDQRQAQAAVPHITSLPPGTGQWAAACQQL